MFISIGDLLGPRAFLESSVLGMNTAALVSVSSASTLYTLSPSLYKSGSVMEDSGLYALAKCGSSKSPLGSSFNSCGGFILILRFCKGNMGCRAMLRSLYLFRNSSLSKYLL
uniref:Uncharacterized protein n=1 Tax=Pyxicephalus adspersus TaxID=30357 RepID=A0AAV2ZS34_PYXAD|nr:TPA: hypothetical protein GDO54_002472 [Pyxicephalus adspersus]